MMRFDADALGDIGIDRALRQEGDIFLLAGFFFKHADKLSADDLTLLFRIGNAGQLVQETVHRVDIDEVGVQLVAEDLDDLFGLTLAEQAVIDVYADELLPDGLDQQGGDNRTIHTAGQGEEHLFSSNLFPDGSDLLCNKRSGKLRGCDSLHCFRAFIVLHEIPPSYKS